VQGALGAIRHQADEQSRLRLHTNARARLVDPLPFEPEGRPSRLPTLQWLRTKRRWGLAD